MTANNALYQMIAIDARRYKTKAFANVKDLMFVDVNSKGYYLNGMLDFSRIAPDCEIQSVECTGHREYRRFEFESEKPITEIVEALAKMFPEIKIRYCFQTADEQGIEYMNEFCYENGELVEEDIVSLDELTDVE